MKVSKYNSRIKKDQINFIDLKKDLFDIEEDPFKFFSTKRPGHFNPQGYKNNKFDFRKN